MILYILLFLILILTFFWYNNVLEKMQNEEPIFIYFNKDELYNYLIKDTDKYYESFSNLDLSVRGLKNLEDYKDKIKEACHECDNNIIKQLNKNINKADDLLREYKCTGFDGEKCANIKWKIGIVDGKSYEGGYPHTRHDVIILPLNLITTNSFINTLIHEKIHVYQKLYPEDIEEYLKENGFSQYKLRKDEEMTRANPDMNEYLYKDKENKIMMAKYNNNPKSLMDVTVYPNNNYNYEHPFEYMAYTISNNII
jgi:hypothetical protein